MEPRIQYAKTSDGVSIAYHSFGSGHAVVALPAIPFRNIQREWELDPTYRMLAELLPAQGRRLVQFDPRGLGSSSRTDAFTLAGFVSDIEAVADSAGLDRFDIVAVTYSCPIAISYAAAHRERIVRLALSSPFVRGVDGLDTPTGKAVRSLRGLPWDVYTDTAMHVIFRGDRAAAERLVALLRDIPPETVKRLYDAVDDFDIEELLERVEAETLVLYPSEAGALISIEQSRLVTSGIPRAKFVMVKAEELLPIMADFLGISDTRNSVGIEATVTSTLRTVLFTDLVGHTEMMSRLGDERGREVLREHERITREVLNEHGGTEVKTMGDGFMASFGSVTKAVECAVALQRAFADREGEPLNVRVGLNAGEPIEEDGDLFGATVILASRIAAKAEGGEILVSDTVRGLCSGKGFLFADRGEFAPKGFDDAVRVYEVRWRE